MQRHSNCRAIVLQSRKVGESHRSLTLLTKDRGIIRPMAYGANSSKGNLSVLSRQFCLGDCWFYTTSKGTKVSDFKLEHAFIGLSENVDKFFTATLWTELLIYSFGGGGDYQLTFDLFESALRHLEMCESKQIRPISALFLWRYLDDNGMEEQNNRIKEEPIAAKRCLESLIQNSQRHIWSFPPEIDDKTISALLDHAHQAAQHMIERPLIALRMMAKLPR